MIDTNLSDINECEQFEFCVMCMARVAACADLGARHADVGDLTGAHYAFRMMIPHVKAAAQTLEDLERGKARREKERSKLRRGMERK